MQPKSVTSSPSPLVLGHKDGGPESAEPPYHVRTVDFICVFATFDREAVRRSLPAELEPAYEEPGFLALYTAPTGWGIAPYSAFFLALPVVGFNSPDGSHGYFMVEGYYTGRAGPIMHDLYNLRLQPGEVRQWNDGRHWHGEVGDPASPMIHVRATPVLPRPATPLTAGVHHYLGERHGGGLNIYSVAYSTEFYPVEDVQLDILPSASPLLQSLQPETVVFSSLCIQMPLTFGPPRPIGTPPAEVVLESARMSLLDLLSRLGQPAALISESGRVIFINGEGETLLAGAIHSGQFEAWRTSDRGQVRRTIETAARSGPSVLPEPIALEGHEQGRPIILQAIPVSSVLAGEPAALVMFSDPARPMDGDPTAALELLGLTRAEARIAARVGAGQTTKEAARDIGITDNTLRSTLQVVYDKLDIQKQSELARIVVRLEGFGSTSVAG